jgi:uncharacterized protein
MIKNSPYNAIFEYVKSVLKKEDNNAAKTEKFLFRVRSEHTRRVFVWANRLLEDNDLPVVDKEALLIAALFHDSGYALSPHSKAHAENSEKIFREYCKSNPLEKEDFIAHLIKNHSNKDLMKRETTPPELILLMEADLLDETGAMSLVWDCMAEGMQEEQGYVKTYNHMTESSCKLMDENPMKTKKAREYWEIKQALVKDFIKAYAFDLGIE